MKRIETPLGVVVTDADARASAALAAASDEDGTGSEVEIPHGVAPAATSPEAAAQRAEIAASLAETRKRIDELMPPGEDPEVKPPHERVPVPEAPALETVVLGMIQQTLAFQAVAMDRLQRVEAKVAELELAVGATRFRLHAIAKAALS